jgi:MFS family permease
MTPQERKITFSVASIYTFRMLGLFMILPVFSLYAVNLKGANPTLIGLALGIYGLTQALLQVPLGMISDRIGRKPVLLFGLLLFVLGSVIAALAHSIDGIILGRALQGAGAIGSTLMALLADSTDETQRLKAMAMIGMTIGLSFVVAMMLGPILNGWVGLAGIFWLTAVLAMLGLLIVLVIPTPKTHILHRDTEPVLSQFKNILMNRELLRLDFGIFTLHALLTALFIVVPISLVHGLQMEADRQWLLYLPVLLVACILMFPLVIISEAKRLLKPFFIMAVAFLSISCLTLAFLQHDLMAIALVLCLFFTAFTFLEASLPSLISKAAPAGAKGTAMGVYSSAQFFGIFVGGSLGGFILTHEGVTSVYYFCGLMGFIWLLCASTMPAPRYLSSKIIKLTQVNRDNVSLLQEKLRAFPGVAEVMISPDEQVAYLKVDKKVFVEQELQKLAGLSV